MTFDPHILLSVLMAAWSFDAGDMAGVTAVSTAGVATFLYVLGQIDKWLQNRKKTWDEINKDSLSGQLQKVVAELAEARKDQKAIRERLHTIRDEANTDRIEATHLREQATAMADRLMEATQEISRLTEKFIEATREISRLTAEVARLSRQSANQPEKTASAVMAAISRSQDTMPVYQDPPPPPKPEAKP